MIRRSLFVENLNNKHRINEKYIKNIAAEILAILIKHCDIRKLEIIFLGDSDIRRFNRIYGGYFTGCYTTADRNKPEL